MNCAVARRRVSEAIPGPSAPEVREHLASCEACGRFAERWAAAAAVLAEPRCDAVPDAGFAGRVAARRSPPVEPFAWAAARLLPAALALAVVLLGWCLAATPGPSELTESAGSDDPLVWIVESWEGDG